MMNKDAPPRFPIHDLTGELPWHKGLRWAVRDIRNVNTTVVHHTGTEYRAGQTIRAHIYAINRGHIEKENWPRIAYHFIIGRQGAIWKCNVLENRTYHSGNAAMNAKSVGICLLGKLHQHDPTNEQLEALRWLVGELGYPAIGHKEVVPTICPGPWWMGKKAWVNGGRMDMEAVQVEPPEAEGCVGSVQLAGELVVSWLRWQVDRLQDWLAGKD